MRRLAFFAAVLVAAASGSAAAARPTERQCAMAELRVLEARMGLMSVTPGFSYEDRNKVITDLDRDKASIIAGLGSAPAYQAAMKEFVLAATDYAKGAVADDPNERVIVYEARVSALKSRFESASERVKLEAELACGK